MLQIKMENTHPLFNKFPQLSVIGDFMSDEQFYFDFFTNKSERNRS